MRSWQRWVPAVILAGGVILQQTVARQSALPLTASLSTIPLELEGLSAREVPISPEEQRVAGMSSFVSRAYGVDSSNTFMLYVGYYESQTQGRTIHSPKNCLPGAGWEPISQSEIRISTALGMVPVNRYLIGNKRQRAIVYYWYQGRGRVSANEYLVKWELLRDASLRHRTDEALVRIVVPVRGTEEAAEALALRVTQSLIPRIGSILPS